jgi:hypothetical protein
MFEPTETVVKATLPSGAVIHVEAVHVGATSAEREVVDLEQVFKFEDLRAALEGIAVAIVETIGKIKPNKAAVEFGVEVGIASGQLTAVLVKGTGKANLKIKLEW